MTRNYAARRVGLAWLATSLFVLLADAPGVRGETFPNCPDGHTAAPFPPAIRPHAVPSNTRNYVGYYQGGGSVFRAEPRYLNEGTWGWDYAGIVRPKHIFLNWSHGRRYQGGTGAYRTVGPSPLHTQ